ncbi:hypothetical protein DRQ09_02065 [candidate division KSB1 bacterium]|nr:MAG: hypothetical protein DRQ09_02065 [candidate division KSB1 bacterium]
MENFTHEIFYTKPENVTDTTFIIEGQEFHHAFRVLRKKIGDNITAVDGAGNRYTGTIIKKISEEKAECKINKTVINSGEPITAVTVFIGLIKGKRFEIFIEKSVEIGIRKIVPLITERSFKDISSQKLERWKNIAISAVKQCRRSILPEICSPLELNSIFRKNEKFDLKLVAHSNKGSKNLSILLKNKKVRPIRKIAILIGPEGGFTENEVHQAETNGFIKVKLGERRLRTETAGIVALTSILLEQNDI